MLSLQTCLGLILLGAVSRANIIQPGTMEVRDGEQVELLCSHPSTTTESIQWYRQVPASEPKHIISGYSKVTNKHDAKLNISSDRKSSRLTLHRLSLQDSAVYYCALTGEANNMRVTFGAGTRLTVTTDIADSSPFVYLLKPAAGDAAEVGPACLVTDFSPANNVTVFLNESTMGNRPASLVRSGQHWSYGVVEWSSKPNDGQFKCMARYKGEIHTSQDGTDDVHANCTVTSVNESFKAGEKLNTLSLAVLALKIIFLKSIAFNLLTTVCLWIS